MNKKCVINYPKRRQKATTDKVPGLAEPERISMYDCLLKNLRIAKRNNYVHRIIYVGEHSFAEPEHLSMFMESIIKKCNESYCIEKLTGFLLYYSKFFVHMVEGDEDNINKHLGMLFDPNLLFREHFGTMKLLIHISHINQRFFDEWTSFTGVPSTLLETIDIASDLQQSSRYVYYCIKKMYALMTAVGQGRTSEGETKRQEMSDILRASMLRPGPSSVPPSPSLTPRSSVTSKISITASTMSASYTLYRLHLPEYELLEFTLNSEFTSSLLSYYQLYGVVPMRDIYKDKVWPVPSDFIPYDIFEKPYECSVEFPKERRLNRKTVEESTLGLGDNASGILELAAVSTILQK